MEHQALARGETHTETPFLPADLVTIDLETDALGLRDLDRLEVGAHSLWEIRHIFRIGDAHRGVIPGMRGQWNHAIIVNPHGHAVQLNSHDQPFQWAGIVVVFRPLAHGSLQADAPSPVRGVLQPPVSSGPRKEDNGAWVS